MATSTPTEVLNYIIADGFFFVMGAVATLMFFFFQLSYWSKKI